MFVIVLRSKFDARIVAWHRAGVHPWTSERSEAEVYTTRERADLVCVGARNMSMGNAEYINVENA